MRAGYACKYTSENWDRRQRSRVQARGQVKSGIMSLHVMTLWKATTVHLAHECMKHEAASKCRRWRANRRRLRRLPSSCMPPRRKAEPRQNPPHASGTGGAASQQPRYRPTKMGSQRLELVAVKRVDGSSCGRHIQKRDSWHGKLHRFHTKKATQPFQPKCPSLIQTPCPRRRPSEASFRTASPKWTRRSCSKKRGWRTSLSLRGAYLAWRAPRPAACASAAGADVRERRLHLLNKPRDASLARREEVRQQTRNSLTRSVHNFRCQHWAPGVVLIQHVWFRCSLVGVKLTACTCG